MTKAELIAQIAEQAEIKKGEAEKALATIIATVATEVKAGRDMALTGLGTFSLSKRAARKGRNPRTGETIKIPASKTVKFRPSKALKDMVK
jgi:DNA-binding protein HU-beta